MRVIEVVIKSIIILVVLLVLCAGESIAEFIATNFDGDFFIGCIVFATIAIGVYVSVKSDKIN